MFLSPVRPAGSKAVSVSLVSRHGSAVMVGPSDMRPTVPISPLSHVDTVHWISTTLADTKGAEQWLIDLVNMKQLGSWSHAIDEDGNPKIGRRMV
jgi:hypothetical protein